MQATATSFHVEGTTANKLSVSEVTETVGNSLAAGQIRLKFITWVRDNDESPDNCALHYGGGWWFKNCFKLNGPYTCGAVKNNVRSNWSGQGPLHWLLQLPQVHRDEDTLHLTQYTMCAH